MAGGFGLTRLASGLVVLVPYVLPGELVSIRVERRGRDYAEALPLGIEAASPDRVTPACPLYLRCGGCDLQHADYAAQLDLKQAVLLDILRRAGVTGPEPPIFLQPPLAAPQPFGYRQRIRLQVDAEGRPGYFRRGSARIVPVSRCALAGPEINAVLAAVLEDDRLRRLFRQVAELELQLNPAAGQVLALLHFKRRPRPADCVLARALCEEVPLLAAILLDAGGAGPRQLILPGEGKKGGSAAHDYGMGFSLPAAEEGRKLSMAFEPGGFCQVNLAQNEKLVRLMIEWVRGCGAATLLDLHCGMGNFSLPLASLVNTVVGVDLQRSAVRSAVRNAALNRLDNLGFLQAAAETAARELREQGRTFDLVLLDPPRRGCAETLPFLPGLGAGHILYLSCDPATMARDLRRLFDLDYQLEKMIMVDMFPQTHHIETLALLRKGSGAAAITAGQSSPAPSPARLAAEPDLADE